MPQIKLMRRTRRGDTIIEVMMAIAIFSLVAILSIAMMNLGVNNAQNALELSVARNEINAQAEALRYVHSSYISEMTLPTLAELNGSKEKYQQYADLWNTIVSNALDPETAKSTGLLDMAELLNNSVDSDKFSTYGCARAYEDVGGTTLLQKANAFVLNTRNLSEGGRNGINVDYSYVSARAMRDDGKPVFVDAPLNARIIYRSGHEQSVDEMGEIKDSTTQFTDGAVIYDQVYQVEGLWVIAVKEKSERPKYYDFYIESCWFGPNTKSPTTLDTVIRLYNPAEVRENN